MKKIFASAILMSLIWTGAEGQDPVVLDSGFESGDAASEWAAVITSSEDRPPSVRITAPVTWSCGIYTDKHTCNDQFLCRWDNRAGICIKHD